MKKQQIEKPNRSQEYKEEQQNLASKYRIELRDFMEQRAEQRKLYQTNKTNAQLAEFWKQRAEARNQYKAAKARGEMA